MFATRLLLIEPSLPLHSWDGNCDLFFDQFCSVWNRIPDQVQSAILELIKAIHPIVELSDAWEPTNAYGQVNSVFRNSQLFELTIRFRAEAFKFLPKKAAEWVIAHELAHVYQKRQGLLSEQDETENEREADRLAEQWGFNKSQLKILDIIQNERKLSIAQACCELSRMLAATV